MPYLKMSKRYTDCADILCLSKYNMYLKINPYYHFTIITGKKTY